MPPLIVPPLKLRTWMRTRPFVPMFCAVFVPVMKTSSATPLSTDSVLSRASSGGVANPKDVAVIPPFGGWTWQPHSTPYAVLVRLVQESVKRPTR